LSFFIINISTIFVIRVLLQVLRTTVFYRKFFQIPRATLPSCAAHSDKFSTCSN